MSVPAKRLNGFTTLPTKWQRAVTFAAVRAFVLGGFLVLLHFAVVGQVEPSDNDTIRVKTSLVLVPVSVKTSVGTEIVGLAKDRFRLFEDGIEQEIVHFETPDRPITVAFLLDQSDSTRISLNDIKIAATTIVSRLSHSDKALVVAFDRNVNRLTRVTSDNATLSLALSALRPGGGTSLYDALEFTVSYLNETSGRKALIILTDGIDTSSKGATFESSASLVAGSNVAVYPIQYPVDHMPAKRLSSENSHMGSPVYTTPSGESISSAYERGTRYLRQLSGSSGGRFQFAHSVKNLQQAFDRIIAELRQQYYLGYYPHKQSDRREKRRLKVTVDAPQARVQSRETFIYTP